MTSAASLNQPYIDVISMDIYGVDFYAALSARYDDLYANHRATPYQQLALIAGTFNYGSEQGLEETVVQVLLLLEVSSKDDRFWPEARAYDAKSELATRNICSSQALT